MMKYGIITFHNTLNCGASLQAYALCRFLRNNGVDCDILNYQCPSILDRELNFKKSSNFIKTLINYILVWPRQKKINKAFLEVMRRENMLSDRIYTPENIVDANKVYHGFITGSDQVWNLRITDADYNYFLKFAEEQKDKISFSASIGEQWDESQNELVINLLNRYSFLSLREKNDCDFLEGLLSGRVDHVCDPTMLLSAEEWSKIAVTPSQKDYILLYNPESGIDKIAKKYADLIGKEIIWIGTGRVKLNSGGEKTVRPEEWIGYIKNSSAVFTDSYHGLLFSLYFNKPVWTVYNGSRGSRQESLYKKLDIYNCVYSEEAEFEKAVDYDNCNRKIIDFRTESASLLLNAINFGNHI